MSHMMIRNARYSKLDALAYYGERTLPKEDIRTSIEALRHRMSSGAIANAIVDSRDEKQQIKFWNQILEYCAKTGVKVITKAQAYDICFNRIIEEGNLIYNPMFRNTLREYLQNTEETNPDGYIGECKVRKIDDVPTLITLGETKYSHYGIPIGNILYQADVKGNGAIQIYILRNKTRLDTEEERIANIVVDSSTYIIKEIKFEIPNEPQTEYDCQFEGLGNKVCGLRIIYSTGLEIRNIQMRKII